MCLPGAIRGKKRVSDLLVLKSQIVVSHHLGAGSKPMFSARAANAVNY